MRTPKSRTSPPRAAKSRSAAPRKPQATRKSRPAGKPRRTAGGGSGASVRVGVVRLAHARDLPLPAYQSAGAAGLDLVAALPASTSLALKPGSRALVPTGLVLELPHGTEAQVRPRSGLAVREGLTVLNSPGTIDSDYRGEVQVLLVNLGRKLVRIARGDRIAQLVVAPVTRADLVEITAASETARGAGGFGSTGRSGSPAAAPASRRGAKGRDGKARDKAAGDKSPGAKARVGKVLAKRSRPT